MAPHLWLSGCAAAVPERAAVGGPEAGADHPEEVARQGAADVAGRRAGAVQGARGAMHGYRLQKPAHLRRGVHVTLAAPWLVTVILMSWVLDLHACVSHKVARSQCVNVC